MSTAIHCDAYQVHAFTRVVHRGNPSGVIVSPVPLEPAVMIRIAEDFGPSVTAFVVDDGAERAGLRWFTRYGKEIGSYCGHATFAAAHVMLRHRRPAAASLAFDTASGVRQVVRGVGGLSVSVPRWEASEEPWPAEAARSIAQQPARFLRSARDILLVYDTVAELDALRPDYAAMLDLGPVGVIAAAPDGPVDVAYRFFCPGFNIGEDEDPATGSALSTLAPYWFARSGAGRFAATQRSPRGGHFACVDGGDEVIVHSDCVTFMSGSLEAQPDGADAGPARARSGATDW